MAGFTPLIPKVKGEHFPDRLPKVPSIPELPVDKGVTPDVPNPDGVLPDTPAVPVGPPPATSPAASLPGRLLKLHALECDENEDWGSDEALLDVFVDDIPVSLPVGREKEMDEGTTWVLNSIVPFLNSVRIELHEEDWPDGDDHLGTVNIGVGPVRGARGRFTLDEADYTLFYDVLEPKELAADELGVLKQFLGIP
jgi:hypothetical protein